MAKNFNSFPGGVPVTGGIEPAGDFPVVESKYVQVSEDGKSLADVLGSGTGSIAGQISSALEPYSTTSQVKAFNDMANYYTKSQLDGATGKVDKSNIATSVTNSSTDAQVVSAKAAYTAIEAAKTVASNNKTDIIESGSAVPVTSGGVYSKLQDYYTKEEADAAASNNKTDDITSGSAIPVTSGGVYSKLQDYYTKDEAEEKFYVAITVTAKFDKTYTVEFKSNSTATFIWTTNTVPTSVKIAGVEAAASYDKITGNKTVTLTTDSIGSKSIGVAVVDRKGGTASASASYTVGYKVFYGQADENTSPNAAFITGLNNNPPIKTNATGINFNGNYVTGQFFYIAFPKTFTVPKFSYNGYASSFTKVGEVTMNVNGTDVVYVLYRNPNKFTVSTGSYNVTTTA